MIGVSDVQKNGSMRAKNTPPFVQTFHDGGDVSIWSGFQPNLFGVPVVALVPIWWRRDDQVDRAVLQACLACVADGESKVGGRQIGHPVLQFADARRAEVDSTCFRLRIGGYCCGGAG